MKSMIFYFSATGNSLFVAKELSKSINGVLVPIASYTNQNEIIIDSNSIGIIFPIYYNRIPVIIENFLNRIVPVNNKYIYFICTYGGGPGESRQIITNKLKNKHIELSASFGIHMPQNAFYKPWENVHRISNKAKIKIKKISKSILQEKKGMLISDRITSFLLSPLNVLVKNPTVKALSKISDSAITTDFNKLIYLADSGYNTNASCNGCGLCEKVCPVNNIQIINKKPKWLNHCENCIACYNCCPQKAITSKIVHKNFYYRHTDITIKEIINQKKN